VLFKQKICEFYDNVAASKKTDNLEIDMDPYERRISEKLVSLNLEKCSKTIAKREIIATRALRYPYILNILIVLQLEESIQSLSR
jgi:hypothetical protein